VLRLDDLLAAAIIVYRFCVLLPDNA